LRIARTAHSRSFDTFALLAILDPAGELLRSSEHMRIVLQRVKRASVAVDGNVTGQIERGILLLLGIHRDDSTEAADFLAAKCAELRISWMTPVK
jgi:hypothetical protein